jgi:carbamoyltransferase
VEREEGNLIILGVTHPISYNNGACILVDGKLVAMVEEERFNRFKHSPRVAAKRSIQYCLDHANGIMPPLAIHLSIFAAMP